MMTLGLTGKVAPYKTGFGPFPGEVFHALFPNALHGISVADALRLGRDDLQERHRGRAAWRPSSSSRCRAKAASTSRRPSFVEG